MSEIDPLDLTPSASIGALRRFGSQADTDALVADAVLGERLRIGAILTCEAAKGRIDAAINVAIRSSMGAEDAAALLESLPKSNSNADAFARALAAEAIGLSGAQHDQAPAALFGAPDARAERLKEVHAAAKHTNAVRYGARG